MLVILERQKFGIAETTPHAFVARVLNPIHF